MMRVLLDVDRWDRASDAMQDLAIAEVARRVAPVWRHVGTEHCVARQQRIRSEKCPDCDGRGGTSPQSGSTDYPDCATCNNTHVLEHPFESQPLAHRVAVFEHVATGLAFVLVPGRIEIAACLIGRAPHTGEPPEGLRAVTAAEARHACLRAGAFDLSWEAGTWRDHPFGLVDAAAPARLACAIPGLATLQVAAFHELVDELGPLVTADAAPWLVRTGYGTADPPRGTHAIAFSRDGRWIATGSIGDVRVWDAHDGRQLSRLSLSTQAEVATLSFAPDHLRIAVATRDDVELFEVATGESLARLGAGLPASRMAPHYNQHRAVAWLPSGHLLIAEATSAGKNHVILWLADPETGELLRERAWEFTDYLYGLALATSFDGSRAAVSLLYEDALVVWDVARWEISTRHESERVSGLAIGGHLLFASGRDKVYAFDTSDDRSHPGLLGGYALSPLAASPDGAWVAWHYHAGVGVFEMASRTMRSRGWETNNPIAFSPDGTRIATGVVRHGFVAIWSTTPPTD